MNGGTCIASAIQKAGQLLKRADQQPAVPREAENVDDGEEGEAAEEMPYLSSADESGLLPGARVLVLLTDGRVDSYQVGTAIVCRGRAMPDCSRPLSSDCI